MPDAAPLPSFSPSNLLSFSHFFSHSWYVVYFPLSLSPANFYMSKFTAMENHVIHGTEFWTSTNIADGLIALATCIEACGHFLSYPGF